MQLSINTIQEATNIPECVTMHELQQATSQDQHLQIISYKAGLSAEIKYHKT